MKPFEIRVVKSGEVENMELSAFVNVNESVSESVRMSVLLVALVAVLIRHPGGE